MIDTVKVKFNVFLDQDQLNGWDRIVRYLPNKTEHGVYAYTPKLYPFSFTDGVFVKCVYRPRDYSGIPLLTVEFSLTKVVCGNNYMMFFDVEDAIKRANDLIKTDPNIPELDIGKGVLLRVDFCYNHMVGSNVQEYISALSRLKYPHRRTDRYEGQGVTFISKKVITKFYDKFVEAGTAEAHGILRHETTIRGTRSLSKISGKEMITLDEITPSMAAGVLQKDLKRLRIEGRTFATKDSALQILSAIYGVDLAFQFMGVISVIEKKPKRRVSDETRMNVRTIERKLGKILDAGLALALSTGKEPLPPLDIEYFE